MITGIVNSYSEATVQSPTYDVQGQVQTILTVVDTGFDGAMTLPASMIQSLGLPFVRSSRTLLADGRESLFDIHEALVIWGGLPRRVLVDTAETDPLLGMALLEDYELRVQVRSGGVFITALPNIVKIPRVETRGL